jgi:hypothetical protein
MEERWTQIEMDERANRMILDRSLAQRMVRTHGEQAHLIALMNLHQDEIGAGKSNIDWRTVMKLINEIQGEKHEQEKRLDE